MSTHAPTLPTRPISADLRTAVVDALLFATIFTITFQRIRWDVGGNDVNLSDITATLFIAAFAISRFERRDWSFPRTCAILSLFFAAFVIVYLIGFFNVETVADRDQFAKGMVKFAIHFSLLIAGVAHLSRRSEDYYWRALGWFVGGIAANAVYGLLELGYAEAGRGSLDQVVLEPITGSIRGGINVFGSVGGQDVFRTNALMLDPNHLGIVLVIPLLMLLPVYLRLERSHRLRTPLAALLGFLLIVELATLSRSGLLGLAAGLLVLAVPYHRLFGKPRFIVPLLGVAAVIAVVIAQRPSFFETVFRARTSLGGGSSRVHLEIYELLPPVLSDNPLFGLGLNTFSTYFEFITGRTNWGPHSYYIALLTETGIVGTVLFLAYLVYFFARLGAFRRLGKSLAIAGETLAAARVRPLAWGLTAALVGTLAANTFYLTMQFYYFFVFAMFAFVSPLVFVRR